MSQELEECHLRQRRMDTASSEGQGPPRAVEPMIMGEQICVVRTEGQTDMTKQTVGFRNFANAPKKRQWLCN
jgi:hypothetical protein